MATLTSKYEAMRRAKQRYEHIRQDHAKLVQQDHSEIEEELRTRYGERNQEGSSRSTTPLIAALSNPNFSSSHGSSRGRISDGLRRPCDTAPHADGKISIPQPQNFERRSYTLRAANSSRTPMPAADYLIESWPPIYQTTSFRTKRKGFQETQGPSPQSQTSNIVVVEDSCASLGSVFSSDVEAGEEEVSAPASVERITKKNSREARSSDETNPLLDLDEVPRLTDEEQPAASFREAVGAVRTQLEAEVWPPITNEFERDVEPTQALTVAAMSAKAVEDRRKATEAARLRRLSEEAACFAKRELDLAWREQRARERVAKLEVDAEERQEKARAADAAAARTRERGLVRQFARARQQLSSVVARQRGYLRERFGRTRVDAKFAARRYQANWELLPRPIEVRLHLVRAVKDRLPKGQYVVLLSMEDRLGGRPLRWSGNHTYSGGGFGKFPAATRPVKHRGRFHDIDLRLRQSVFALCPSRRDLRPGNALVFEMFRLADRKHPHDVVVGWFALPMCDPEHFGVVAGKFRLPVLRGPINRAIERYSEMHEVIANDLAAWLGNIYFEIRHLPRETIDERGILRNEHHIEYDFVNKLLQLPKHVRDSRLNDHSRRHNVHRPAKVDMDGHLKDKDHEILTGDAVLAKSGREEVAWWRRTHTIFNRKGSKVRRACVDEQDIHLQRSRHDSERRSSTETEDEESDEDEPIKPPQRDEPLFLESSETSRLCGHEVIANNEKPDLQRRTNDGARYDDMGLNVDKHKVILVHAHSDEDEYDKSHGNNDNNRIETGLNKDERRDANPYKKATPEHHHQWWTDLELSETTADDRWREFTPAVGVPKAHRRPMTRAAVAGTKVKFMWQEMFQDFTPDECSTLYAPTTALSYLCSRLFLCFCHWKRDKLLRMSVYAGAFWTRVYIHYLGQWLLLSALRVAVYDFRTRVYAIEFKYSPSRMTTLGEVAVVASGPVTVLLYYCSLIASGHVYRRFASGAPLPEIFSHYMSAFGFAGILDPLLVFLVDVALQNYSCDTRPGCREDYTSGSCHCFEGDAFKLWRRMTDDENGGIVGVFYTAITYIITSTVAFGLVCLYLVHLHANGRVYDTYCRIFGDDTDFFLPEDFEISLGELKFVLEKAKRWCGPQDERRKIVVSEIQATDDCDAAFKETHTRIIIYETHLDGSGWVYRSFVRRSDGTIEELFGDAARAVDSADAASKASPREHCNFYGDSLDSFSPCLSWGNSRAMTTLAVDNSADVVTPALTGYFAGLPTLTLS